MKLNELRVGNAYLSTKWRRPVICDLTDFYELYERADGAYDDPPVDEIFEPLPVTNEELIKLGFNKNAFNILVLESDQFYLCKNNEGIWLAIHEISDEIYLPERYIKLNTNYVHELQDMWLSLTGKELTYNIEYPDEIQS